MNLNFLSGVGKFSPGSLTESQKRRRFKIVAPSGTRTRKLSTSSNGSTGTTGSTKSIGTIYDDDDENDDDEVGNKSSFEFVPYLKVMAEHFLDNYAKHSHGIMSRKVLNNFKETGKFENSAADTAVEGLINQMKKESNLTGTDDDEKEQKIRNELIKLIKERYNTNLDRRHTITHAFIPRLGGKRKTRKSKKSKRSTRKHK
jgi:hypothetical protein